MPKYRAVPFRSRHMERLDLFELLRSTQGNVALASHRKGVAMAVGSGIRAHQCSCPNRLAGRPILQEARPRSCISRASRPIQPLLASDAPAVRRPSAPAGAVRLPGPAGPPRCNAEGVNSAFSGQHRARVRPFGKPRLPAPVGIERRRRPADALQQSGRCDGWESRNGLPIYVTVGAVREEAMRPRAQCP